MTEARTPYALTSHEEQVLMPTILTILRGRVGKRHAVTAESLARLFNLKDDRKVRRAIAELIENDYPIASTTGKPGGYYWIAESAEARTYLGDLRKRVFGIWRRYHAFSKAAEKNFNIPYEQLPLEMDK